MNLRNRVVRLENRRAPEQDIEVLLSAWLSDEPVRYKSMHLGRKDIQPEVPEYTESGEIAFQSYRTCKPTHRSPVYHAKGSSLSLCMRLATVIGLPNILPIITR